MFPSAAPALSTPARVNPEFAQAVNDGLTKKGQKTLPACCSTTMSVPRFSKSSPFCPNTDSPAPKRASSNASPRDRYTSGRPALIIELGSGTGIKTRHVLEPPRVTTRSAICLSTFPPPLSTPA